VILPPVSVVEPIENPPIMPLFVAVKVLAVISPVISRELPFHCKEPPLPTSESLNLSSVVSLPMKIPV